MACEDEVLPGTCHVRVEAAVMHAEALNHVRSSTNIKDAQSSQLCCGLVATQSRNEGILAIAAPIWQSTAHAFGQLSQATVSGNC